MLSELDALPFEALCESWADLKRAKRRLQSLERRTTDLALLRKGELSVERSLHSFRQLAGEFGLTPAARNRLDLHTPIGSLSDDDAALEAEFFADKYLRPQG